MSLVSFGSTIVLASTASLAFVAVIGIYVSILINTLIYRSKVNITSEDEDSHVKDELKEGKIENVHTIRPLWLNAIAAGLAIFGLILSILVFVQLFL